jgi:formylglycine-generating enzyme required for sulfatase activity/nitrate/TMAO reductase-like tetraheme cytochrome c subunit
MKLKILKLSFLKSRVFIGLVIGSVLTCMSIYFFFAQVKRTSTNEYCESCHVHPQATESWEDGAHYKNASGVVTNCVDCHLPPEGVPYLVEKAKAGARDLYSFYFTDTSLIDWEAKSGLEHAASFTFDDSCTRCHAELFPPQLNNKGLDAHIHYQKNIGEVLCINCHLKTGHFHDEPDEQFIQVEEEVIEDREMAPLLTEIEPGAFVDYTEVIPGSGVKFEMVAVDGGSFLMGSPETEAGRSDHEGPQREVKVSSYWIGKTEVSWREFDAYYLETVTREKNELGEMSDAITGPTPPYGSPDQGWGKGSRPAITMSHYAARKYCEWLSMVTGRKYRLPTEAEWEFAARAGTEAAYFFTLDEPESWFASLKRRILGGSIVDNEVLGRFAWFAFNSDRKTHPPFENEPNPLGLYNMFGNAKEFCLDWYAPDAFSLYPAGQVPVDPRGPESGTEHVVRGGSYRSEANELRSGARDVTQHDAWLKTDPQNPKSVWWYSDSREVGFRIVREFGREDTEGGSQPETDAAETDSLGGSD